MLQERFAVGVLVNAFEADRPAIAAEIARIPGKTSGTQLRHLVAKRSRIALLVDFDRSSDLELVEVV